MDAPGDLSLRDAHLPEPPAARRRGAARWFFVGYGALFLMLAVIGFGPSFYDFFTGAYDIPWTVHVHGAVMMGWLGLLVLQATMAARGELALHQRLGSVLIWWAVLVELTMMHASYTGIARNEPTFENMPFLFDVFWVQIGSMILFPTLVVWGGLLRTNSGWHRRLMTFSALVLIQAAVDRMFWLPDGAIPLWWAHALRLEVVMLPLFVFDLMTLKRVHPATWAGAGLIVLGHAIVIALWEQDGARRIIQSFVGGW